MSEEDIRTFQRKPREEYPSFGFYSHNNEFSAYLRFFDFRDATKERNGTIARHVSQLQLNLYQDVYVLVNAAIFNELVME